METYNGHVRTPADAIILFEACRLGLLPRVQRRLSEKERQSIKSGSVFVWDEREAGMRRWTDGKSWSASRVSGSFLTYREMEGKRGGNGFAPPLVAARAGKTPDGSRGSDSDLELAGEDGPDGYRYKPDGLMKQSFSITTSTGNHLHLISYYARSHPTAQGLTQPTNDPALRHIRPQKGMYPESTVHEQQNIPAVTRSPMVSGPLAQTPQMAGYARSGPTHPLAYSQPGYGWPSPPTSSINNTYGFPYGQATLPPPPPPPPPQQQVPHGYMAHNTNSPLSYPQQMPQPTQPPPLSYGRTSSPPSDNTLPRPTHTTSHHRSSSSGSGYPQYLPNPAQHMSQPSSIAQPAPQHPLSQHPSRHSSPSSTPPMSKIDPRLMAPSPLSQHQTLINDIKPRTPSPPQPKREYSSTPTQREASVAQPGVSQPGVPQAGTSQASTIPSIGALMNGAPESLESRAERENRSHSRSPGGTKAEGPQDIPSEKLGFGEDMRALRVLDRAFKT
ncbi:hypothetical protein MMC30_009360 [Trapelia coarctata]|nr:hypothetical protein [Trapelia coarctata]